MGERICEEQQRYLGNSCIKIILIDCTTALIYSTWSKCRCRGETYVVNVTETGLKSNIAIAVG